MHKLEESQSRAWHNEWYDTKKSGGRFERHDALFRNWITADGACGSTGTGGFKAESGRYHVYLSLACPWAHRVLLTRVLKKLTAHISVSVTRPYMGKDSWSFTPEAGRLFRSPGEDDFYIEYLYQLYRLVDPQYSDRATVPVLWDKQQQTIVSNESADIIRMLNSEFSQVCSPDVPDLCPPELIERIDHWNERLYPSVNNGVYAAGFATTQKAYEEAVYPLFAMLDELEAHLASRRFLCGSHLTEADIRLFPTLVRFDSVYVSHFKCSIKRLVDYPHLWAYTRDIYQLPGISATVDLDYNKEHYYTSHATVNPTGIIPVGPALDFMQPHNRGSLA